MKDKSLLVSYIALGVSAIALIGVMFGAFCKPRYVVIERPAISGHHRSGEFRANQERRNEMRNRQGQETKQQGQPRRQGGTEARNRQGQGAGTPGQGRRQGTPRPAVPAAE